MASRVPTICGACVFSPFHVFCFLPFSFLLARKATREEKKDREEKEKKKEGHDILTVNLRSYWAQFAKVMEGEEARKHNRGKGGFDSACAQTCQMEAMPKHPSNPAPCATTQNHWTLCCRI